MLHSMVPEATFCMDWLLNVQSYGKDFDILTLGEIFGRGGLDIDDIHMFEKCHDLRESTATIESCHLSRTSCRTPQLVTYFDPST
ncbi:class II aldolase/adducin domain protein [Histoplasma capsulatum G186AR]|uniref:Class II aldolase/adducin domain protein n=1 Tax=Ajellomyces capsulatus TaxID=5037 RepID=A0A8H7YJL5_AJECA|nr:class II aldolase/adducin domain protein [Histoplasma capsulatum]QSS72925.1 class II aldolase/adducin domain protein [Histoplasma capsulatum G186AR]